MTSAPAALTLWGEPGQPTRLAAVSARSVAGTDERTLIAGFVIAGSGSKPVLVRGLGPALLQYNVSQPLPDPWLRVFDGGSRQIVSNDDWGGAPTLSTAFAAVGLAPLSGSSKDAALFSAFPTGGYTVHVGPAEGSAVSDGNIALLELYDAGETTDASRISALSLRSEVGSGDRVLIVGFVVSGTGTKNVIIRGLGPALGQAGVADALADPQLTLRSGDQLLRSNDDWGGDPSLAAEFAAAGLAPLAPDSKDAAILMPLPPGVYTVQLSAPTGRVGIGMIEFYETR